MRTEKLRKINKWAMLACILVGTGSLVALFFVSLRGSHSVGGKYPEDFISNSISCEVNNLAYPFFSSYMEAPLNQTTKVNIIFNEGVIDTISLTHTMYWNDAAKSLTSYNFNHVDMNKSFGAASLGVDALGARYTTTDDKSILSLYATTDELNHTTLKYFLIDTTSTSEKDDSWYEQQYEKQGFACQHNN